MITLPAASAENPRTARRQDTLLSVRNVSKKFCKDLKRSMWYGVTDLAGNLVGVKPPSQVLRGSEFWALRDMSFELKRGQVLGVMGLNGSGKTTLLRLLAGILPPDRGEISVKGKVASLISLGAIFHPLLTGRENIYLKGTLMKMTHRELDEKLRSIIDFAELGDFIDSPVGTYSSGMRVRLGFAIATAMEPDVLLLDEILAVGDRNFKAKCLKKIDELSKRCGVILVSHMADKVMRLATSIIVIDRGQKVFESEDVSKGIDFYNEAQLREAPDAESVSGTGGATVRDVRFLFQKDPSDGFFKIGYLEDLEMEIVLSADRAVAEPRVEVSISDIELQNVAHCRSSLCRFPIRNDADEIRLRVKFPRIQLAPRTYYVSVAVKDEKGVVLAKRHAANRFSVTGNFSVPSPFHLDASWSYV